jgi:hypothetical protein
MTPRCCGRRPLGRVAALLAVVLVLVTPALVLGSPAGGATTNNVGRLLPISCAAVKGEPAIEAPSYAQTEGAGGQTSGWWCQLPHPTKMPSNLVASSRVVEPFTNTYASYATVYTLKGTAATALAGDGPSIVVAPYADSAVAPSKQLRYGSQPKGQTVALGRGVTATLVKSKKLVTVYWRYPRSGVPKYLRGVTSVTVTGTHVPVATVIAVAQSVRPN